MLCLCGVTSGDSSNDGDISSVMGFSGFGECFWCIPAHRRHRKSHMFSCNKSLTLRKESSNLWPGGHVWADEADGHREKSARFRSVRLLDSFFSCDSVSVDGISTFIFPVTEERQKQEVEESSVSRPVSHLEKPSTSMSRYGDCLMRTSSGQRFSSLSDLSCVCVNRKQEADSSSSDSDSDVIGPPLPPQKEEEDDNDDDDVVGPPLPPGYKRSTADSDDDDDDDDDEARARRLTCLFIISCLEWGARGGTLSHSPLSRSLIPARALCHASECVFACQPRVRSERQTPARCGNYNGSSDVWRFSTGLLVNVPAPLSDDHALFPAGDHGGHGHAGILLRVYGHVQRARAGLLLLRDRVHETLPRTRGHERHPARPAVRGGHWSPHIAGESLKAMTVNTLIDKCYWVIIWYWLSLISDFKLISESVIA